MRVISVADKTDFDHGFHNDTTARWDEEAAELVWRRTVEYFQEHL